MKPGVLEAHLLAQYEAWIGEYPPLTPETERALRPRIAARDAGAIELLVRSHLRTVVTIADEFGGRGLARSALIEAGNVGLGRAAHGFDGSADVRFADYAAGWIRAAMEDAVKAGPDARPRPGGWRRRPRGGGGRSAN